MASRYLDYTPSNMKSESTRLEIMPLPWPPPDTKIPPYGGLVIAFTTSYVASTTGSTSSFRARPMRYLIVSVWIPAPDFHDANYADERDRMLPRKHQPVAL